MSRAFIASFAALLLASAASFAQDASTNKATDRVTGTITQVNHDAHTITVKEDKTGTEYTVQLENTKTLLKVPPTAKDLKSATRITADDLATGDRVQVGGTKGDGSTVAARSVLLMSARELQQVHEQQAAAWQHSTPGVVTAVDAAGQKLSVTARTPEGTKPLTVDVAKTQFTRYSPESPKTPANSQVADIQPGDQVRMIGEMSSDGSTLTAQQIYSSSFRNVVGTVSSIAPDGKTITIKDLQTKQPVVISLNDESAIHRLPPMMAYGLARRFNPDFKAAQGAPGSRAGAGGPGGGPGAGPGAGGPGAGTPGGNWRRSTDTTNGGAPGANGPAGGPGGGNGPGGGMRGGNGDLSQMLERLPKISTSELKSGDAVVVSGSPLGSDKSHLLATTVIAGVEPIFQSASPRQAQSLGDWGASLGGGAAGAEGGMPPQ